MRIVASILLVFGIVAGLGAAFRGPFGFGHRYGYAYGPCGPVGPEGGWYGPWSRGGWPQSPAAPPMSAPPAGTPATPVVPAPGPTQ